MCSCEKGTTAQECALLGSSVGTQDATVTTCHVITCAHLEIDELTDNLPSTATKVDLQNLNVNSFSANPSQNPFAGLSVLDTVYIEGIPLANIDGGIFADCTKMRVLELSVVDIATVPADGFAGSFYLLFEKNQLLF